MSKCLCFRCERGRYTYFATITEDSLYGDWPFYLRIRGRSVDGVEFPEFDSIYKTEKAALNKLKRYFVNQEWSTTV